MDKKHFTIELVIEMSDLIAELKGKKDSELPIANKLEGIEFVPILQYGLNKLTRVSDILISNDLIIDKPLVDPIILGTWSNGSTDKELELINGQSINWEGYFKWEKQVGKRNPERISLDNSFTDVLPAEGELVNLILNDITTDTEIIASIEAPVVGIKVGENGFLYDEGIDYNASKYKVTFYDELYYGSMDDSFQWVNKYTLKIKDLSQQFNLNTTIGTGEPLYGAIAYPITYNNIDIFVNNIKATDTFGLTTMKMTNSAGKLLTYLLYYSDYKGAFDKEKTIIIKEEN